MVFHIAKTKEMTMFILPEFDLLTDMGQTQVHEHILLTTKCDVIHKFRKDEMFEFMTKTFPSVYWEKKYSKWTRLGVEHIKNDFCDIVLKRDQDRM